MPSESHDSRERRLTAAFVTLADTLVAGYDVFDLLQTLVDSCAELLDASAVGLMLADERGDLSVVASTPESNEFVNLVQPPSGSSPSIACFSTGRVIEVPNIADSTEWGAFAADGVALGFLAVHVVPMRLRGTVIGSLTLFRSHAGGFLAEDASVIQGLADVATIGILHERAVRESSVAQQQLQRALDSRVLIEQAKGVVSYSRSVDMDEAFRVLRSYARSNGLHLRDVAEGVVNRSLTM